MEHNHIVIRSLNLEVCLFPYKKMLFTIRNKRNLRKIYWKIFIEKHFLNHYMKYCKYVTIISQYRYIFETFEKSIAEYNLFTLTIIIAFMKYKYFVKLVESVSCSSIYI